MAILEIRNLDKHFGGLQVIMGVTLAIEAGEHHAVIGPNGAGKSTLFNLITGKYKPTAGEVLYKGHNITGLPPHRIARMGLTRSFQITNIFKNMTVFENIRNAVLSKNRIRYNVVSRLSKMNGISGETEEILQRIGLLDRKDEISGELAHGHKRALELGLALAMDPEVILLDEPTAGMPTEETMQMVELIEKNTAGKALVIVEHDMDVVFSIADRITVLYYGTILASGTPDQIRNDQRVKDAYLGEEDEAC
jgi:branched-chain amino acid transport system ATP-binding protein